VQGSVSFESQEWRRLRHSGSQPAAGPKVAAGGSGDDGGKMNAALCVTTGAKSKGRLAPLSNAGNASADKLAASC
jgi:hypothetical protein